LSVHQALSESTTMDQANDIWAHRANIAIDVIHQDITEVRFAYDSCSMNYSIESGTLKMQGITPGSIGHQISISREQMEGVNINISYLLG